jgi:hypothetical protein
VRRYFEDIEMSESEAAYLAGIIDGEGWVSLGSQRDARTSFGKNRYYYVLIGVTNTHKPLLEWVVETTKRGRVAEGTTDSHLGKKRRWSWTCRGWSAADVLRAVRPYLIVKADRADIALEFADARHRYHGRVGRDLPPEAVVEYQRIYDKFKQVTADTIDVPRET